MLTILTSVQMKLAYLGKLKFPLYENFEFYKSIIITYNSQQNLSVLQLAIHDYR